LEAQVPIRHGVVLTAASDCGAHARALQYFEAHVRSRHGGTLNPVALRNATYSDDDVSFLQVGPHGICAGLPCNMFINPK
jgi:hypothetical protein